MRRGRAAVRRRGPVRSHRTRRRATAGTARPKRRIPHPPRQNDGALRWIARNAEYVRDAAGQRHRDARRHAGHHRAQAGRAGAAGERGAVPHAGRDDAAPGVDRHGPTARIDWFNRRVHEYCVPPDEQLGDRTSGWTSFIPMTPRRRARRGRRRSPAGALYETEFRVCRADGAYRWHLVRAVPMPRRRSASCPLVRHQYRYRGSEGQALDALSRSNQTLESQIAERTADRDRMWRLSTDVMLVADFAGSILLHQPGLGAPAGLGGGRTARHQLHAPRPSGRCGRHPCRGGPSWRRALPRCGSTTATAPETAATVPFSWTAVPASGLIHAVGRDVTDERQRRRRVGARARGTAAGAEDGGGGPADRRHRARFQ